MSEKKKFFFDLNNFDEHTDELSEEEVAFLEKESALKEAHKEEVQRTRENSYEKGKQDGYEEARQSLEQKIALLLENSKQGLLELQANEHLREKRYEEEAAFLALHIFKGIYPAWTEKLGLGEIEHIIQEILRRVSNQKSVIIEVNSALKEELERRMEPLRDELTPLTFDINGKDTLSEADFKVSWADGGAVRNSHELALQILNELEQSLPPSHEESLAETAETRHNKKIEAVQEDTALSKKTVEEKEQEITNTSEQSDE